VSSKRIFEVVVLGQVSPLEPGVPLLQLQVEPVVEPLGEAGSIDILGPESQQLVAGVAEPPERRGVGVEDLPFIVVDDDDVFDPLEQGPGPPLRSDQRLLGADPDRDVEHRAPETDDPPVAVQAERFLDR